ncbi:MAG: hypothetical protein ABIJ91_00745 [Candidatus Kuenenbacteria bacterium]
MSKKKIVIYLITLIILVGLFWFFWPKGYMYGRDDEKQQVFSYSCLGFTYLEKRDGLILKGVPAICYGVFYNKRYFDSYSQMFQ